jgi:hypothetical protein
MRPPTFSEGLIFNLTFTKPNFYKPNVYNKPKRDLSRRDVRDSLAVSSLSLSHLGSILQLIQHIINIVIRDANLFSEIKGLSQLSSVLLIVVDVFLFVRYIYSGMEVEFKVQMSTLIEWDNKP